MIGASPQPLLSFIEGEGEKYLNGGASDEERAVWPVLQTHVGRASAISLKVLVSETKLNTRTVRDAIHSLIVSHHKLIGSSSSGKRGGYWVVETDEELAEALGELRSRIKRLAARARALDKSAYRSLLSELQPPLWSD